MGCTSTTAASKEDASGPVAEKKMTMTEAFGVTEDDRKFNPRKEIAGLNRQGACEQKAREYQATNRDQAWAVLNACVDARYFTDLRQYLSGAWDTELETRKDTLEFLTKLIAARGGDVRADLALFAQLRPKTKNPPFMVIDQVMDEPKRYRGQAVVVLVRVDQVEPAGTGARVECTEVIDKDKPTSSWEGNRWSPGYHSFARNQLNVEAESTNVFISAQFKKSTAKLKAGNKLLLLVHFNGVRKDTEGKEWAEVEPLKAFEASELAVY